MKKKNICNTCVFDKYDCRHMMGGRVKVDWKAGTITACDNYEKDEGQDRCYFIRPENWDSWLGSQTPTAENTIISLEEIRQLADGWNKWACDLMQDVDKINNTEKQEIIAKYFE
jgi:hypothetical protein